MKFDELQEILRLHRKWLHGETFGSDADLSDADLRRADLSGADLSGMCLDDELLRLQRLFCRQCPPVGRHGAV